MKNLYPWMGFAEILASTIVLQGLSENPHLADPMPLILAQAGCAVTTLTGVMFVLAGFSRRGR